MVTLTGLEEQPNSLRSSASDHNSLCDHYVINQPNYRQLKKLYLVSLTGEDALPIADLVHCTHFSSIPLAAQAPLPHSAL